MIVRSNQLNIVPVGAIAACGLLLLAGCSRALTKDGVTPAEPRPEVRIDLSAHGLPKDFFHPGADTECSSQIIGYRFVVWLNSNDVAVGFNTSPNCRPSPDRKVSGSARVLVFNSSGDLRAKRDIPYLADGNGELVAEGEARPGPSGTLLFRMQSVNLDEAGRNESKSGVLLLDAKLNEVVRLDRFLEQTTFVDHALVFQEGFTFGNVRTYSLFAGAPLAEAKRWQQEWPVDARDRKFGEHGVAYMACRQELRPKQYESTGVVYAGAKQLCTMTVEGDHHQGWTVPLREGETASIIGVLADLSVVGNISVKGSKAGRLVIWKKDQPMETLGWIPDTYCGSIESATPDMSRYAALASDNCNDMGGLLRLLGEKRSMTDVGHWIVLDRRSQTPIADRLFPKNGRAALSPDGLRYATFESGELRIYSLPEPK
jgi:hypothetical protein